MLDKYRKVAQYSSKTLEQQDAKKCGSAFHHRMSEILGTHLSSLGVEASAMLKPLKMIISTSTGGNSASATSVEGAAAPKKRPRPPAARPSRQRVPQKAPNALSERRKLTKG
eukprot:6194907-Pleurochrysis_carterae.AAC.2